MSKPKVVGTLSDKVIKQFNLTYELEQEIYCGEDNKQHMMDKHPEDFNKYGDKLEEIINNPDYIAKHPKKDSIEFVKEFKVDNDYVLVAVRATGSGVLFARTLFVMDDEKVKKYRNKNALIPYKND